MTRQIGPVVVKNVICPGKPTEARLITAATATPATITAGLRCTP